MEFLIGMDLPTLIRTVGYIGLFAITCAESGLFVGFFLPGDSLLFTAGFLASQGFLDLTTLCIVVFLGAVTGDTIGYSFGRYVGPKIFTRENSLFFHKDHIARTQAYYEKYGGLTIVIARFLAIVRTFAPILAGVGNMRYRTFVFYNITGGLLWTGILVGLGYTVGNVIPDADKYLLPIILLIILLSVSPILYNFIKHKEMRDRLIEFIRTKK